MGMVVLERVRWPVLAALAIVCPGSVSAAGLVEGRYAQEVAATASPSAERAGIDLGLLDLQFTPRAAFARGSAGSADRPPFTLRLSLDDGAGDVERLDRLNMAPSVLPDRIGGSDAPISFLTGGAFEISGLSIGGSFLESDNGLAETRVAGADVTYGPVSAKLAWGQTEFALDASEREFYLFSTNLAARSWLSLEGDLGYTPPQATDPGSTVGRIGVKFRF